MVGTWTYNPSTNTITVTGGTAGAPAGFVDAWNADKAGTLDLASRTGISAIDGSPVNLTYNLRPTDYYVLGGAAQDLYIVISAWTNMVSATIRLIGTDSAGNAQTEDIVVTGNGTYYATKYFHTLTQSQVTAFTKSDSGSFAYMVTQGQWGVSWKYNNNQYQFDFQLLNIGNGSTSTYFGDTKKQITFPVASGGGIISLKANATLRLGALLNPTRKTTADGCSLLSTIGVSGSTGIALIYDDSATGLMYLYGCFFSSIRPSYIQPRHTSQVYNCIGDNCLFFVRDTVDYYNLEVYNATLYWNPCAYIIQTGTATTVNLRAYDCTNGIYGEGSNSGVISNAYFRGLTNIARFYLYTGNMCLINADTDTWSIIWVGAQAGILYRQYTFDLTVTDTTGTPISVATVTLKDKNNNTIFSVTTDGNGQITTQTVTRGYYDQAHGNTLQDSSPYTLIITKAGWQKYVKTFTLTEKTKWEIKLAKAQQILLDLGKSVLNLNPSDPENKAVMRL